MRKTLPILARPFPDDVHIPYGFPNPGEKVDYEVFRRALSKVQGGICPACSKSLAGIVDVHEGVVTKGNVQGWPKPWRIIIVNPYNCVLLHRACHQHGLKDLVWEHKCALFGEEEIRKWYYSLPFKSFPREFGRLIDD